MHKVYAHGEKVYMFGMLNFEEFPRPLVWDGSTFRPATIEEFVEHHEEMAQNVLLERVSAFSEEQLKSLLAQMEARKG